MPMQNPPFILRTVCHTVVATVVLIVGLLPSSVSAQSAKPPAVPGASPPIAQPLSSTPAYPYFDQVGANGQNRRVLQTVTTSRGPAVANRVLIQVDPRVGPAELAVITTRASAQGAGVAAPVLKIDSDIYLVDVSGADDVEAAAKAFLTADQRVLSAEVDDVVSPSGTIPNDTLLDQQRYLDVIHAQDAWDRSHGDGIRIAIVDSGIDETHPDLGPKIDDRTNVLWLASSTNDVLGHGTGVAGQAAAVANNGQGVAGVGFNARLLNIKALDDDGVGTISGASLAIIWAIQHNANVINLSLAHRGDCEPSWIGEKLGVGVALMRRVIERAYNAGIVVVAGAGNSANTDKHVPAACPHVIAVADTFGGVKTSTSTFGSWVHIAAPGLGSFTTAVPGGGECRQPFGRFALCDGTSAATPKVSGVAALMLATCGPIGPQGIIDRLAVTSDPISGTGSFWQFGQLNADRATCFARPTELRLSSSTDTSMFFQWRDNSFNETRFEFERRPAGGTWSTVTLAPNATSLTVVGLPTGAAYEFRVRGCDARGCSDYSNVVAAKANSWRLNVLVSGTGKVTSTPSGISCGFGLIQCLAFYAPGATVTLVPTPLVNPNTHDEFAFDHWEGACAGQLYTCTVTMNQTSTARAVFVKVGHSGG